MIQDLAGIRLRGSVMAVLRSVIVVRVHADAK